MSLKTPTPGLHSMHYDAVSPAKVSLVVQPGDEMVVSADVAAQLAATSPQFKDVTPAPVVVETAAQPKSRARK